MENEITELKDSNKMLMKHLQANNHVICELKDSLIQMQNENSELKAFQRSINSYFSNSTMMTKTKSPNDIFESL